MADLPQCVVLTSGRAALYQALLQLGLPAGSVVLVPTYHCPTMVAPVILAGLTVNFYALRDDGQPDLDTIEDAPSGKFGAIIVPHYFGLPQSLAEVRAWCDKYGTALIEDCAHCLFGTAGGQPVGTWGDFVTASVSKFLPVPEAGLLASSRREIVPFELERRGFVEEFKGIVDVLEFSAVHQGMRPFDFPMNLLFNVKNARRQSASVPVSEVSRHSEDMMHLCDMGRIKRKPLWISRFLSKVLSKGSNIDQRRKNFTSYLEAFRDSERAHPLHPELPDDAVPYVFPLWVDDPEHVYAAIRARRLPVFRWDRLWPGTPDLKGDVGGVWSKHVLQLLCHQSLSSHDIHAVSDEIKNLL